MSKKKKNKIDLKNVLELFKDGYSFMVKVMNFYQLRISMEESEMFFDWYHTTGSLVSNTKGYHKSEGIIKDPEDVAIFMKKRFYSNI